MKCEVNQVVTLGYVLLLPPTYHGTGAREGAQRKDVSRGDVKRERKKYTDICGKIWFITYLECVIYIFSLRLSPRHLAWAKLREVKANTPKEQLRALRRA